MRRDSALDINVVKEALAALDNRYNEWHKSLTPLWQFFFFLMDGLRIAFEFPLFSDTKRHTAALYAIAEDRYIREQLATEREQLRNQREVMRKLEKDVKELLEKNTNQIREWEKATETEETGKDQSTHYLRGYYLEMIDYMKHSSRRLSEALKKITATAIDSDESLVFNDLQQHSSLVCYMQDRNILRQQLQKAKNQRLEIERVRNEIQSIMASLHKPDQLEAIYLGPFPVPTSREEQA